jgi:cytochrome c oxidase subunit II
MTSKPFFGGHDVKKTILAAAAMLFMSGIADASQAVNWGMDLQGSSSDMMTQIRWFFDYTLWFVVPITLFVLALLIYVGVRFSEKNNPVPSKTSHNTLIEIIWTLGPVLVLLLIAVPSFQLLTYQFTPPKEASLTIKATGYQWYWGYEYQDKDAITMESRMIADADRAATGKTDLASYPNQLAVDNEMVVPVNAVVRLIVTGNDVIHSFAMQPFGIKIDAMPGRLNETWFMADKVGLYYGQCSEICGKDHSAMPIAIRVVDQAKYDAWATQAKADLPGAYKALIASIDADKNINVAAK